MRKEQRKKMRKRKGKTKTEKREQTEIRTWKLIRKKENEKKCKDKRKNKLNRTPKKRRKQAHWSKSDRSPHISFLGYKDKNLSPARTLYRIFCNSITVMPYETGA